MTVPPTMRVCVFTGSRSEYGLLRPVILALRDAYDTTILVGGAHTRAEHGGTVGHIAADGLDALIYRSVWTSDDSASLHAQASGVGVQTIGCAEALASHRPDCLLVYGDRSEALAAAVAAHYQAIPVAHLEAGDTTAGGMPDDRTRDAITSLATLALTTNEPARQRCEQAFPHALATCVGLPSIDTLRAAMPIYPVRDRPTILLAQNPWPGDHHDQIRQTLRALSVIGAYVIATRPNGDPGSAAYLEALTGAPGVEVLSQLPPADYYALLASLAAMASPAVMVGNSSSALKEAPYAPLPVVDIGPRQAGRLRSPLTLHAEHNALAIAAAITTAMAPLYRNAVRAQGWTGYGTGKAAEGVAQSLEAARATLRSATGQCMLSRSEVTQA